MRIKTHTLILLLCIGLFSCKNSNESCQALLMPNKLRQISRDSSLTTLNSAGKVSLIVLFDSTVCSPCLLKDIYKYDRIFKLEKELGSNYVPMMVFSPKSSEVSSFVESYNLLQIKLNVYIDENHQFNLFNPCLKDNKNVFLLDESCHIVKSGTSESLFREWNAYKNQIKEMII